MATEIVTPNRLRTALQVAKARATTIAREEWASRLDPAAYRCERQGEAWVAEGPAGQRFEFRLIERFTTGHAAIEVRSHSGEQYSIHAHWPGSQCVCNCPSFAAGKLGAVGCKHSAAWVAVKRAAKGEQAASLPIAA